MKDLTSPAHLTAAAILGTLSSNYALAQQVAEDDDDIIGKDITYNSLGGTGQITAYRMRIYPGVNHGLHNNTTARFDAEAAALAEERMVAWFRTYLV